MTPIEQRLEKVEAELEQLRKVLHVKPSRYMSKKMKEELQMRKQILFGGKKK